MSPFEPPEAREPRPLIARVREDFGHKAIGAGAALVLELLIVLVLWSLNEWRSPRREVPIATVTFDAREESEQAPPKPEQAKASPVLSQPTPPTQPQPSPVPVVTPPPPTVIPVSPQQMQSLDISQFARRPNPPSGPVLGPAYAPTFGDSKRVGTAPNGQPMYAASWYREPTDQELRGYLSTANGPGWGLITCRTVPDYRVEDCVGLDEYPEGSHMLRAVLAAAWQFRVRPPRVGGVPQVGDWVRIRIEYDLKPAPAYGDPARP